MHVDALDHVNIITPDLEGSARFYAELFGLQPRDAPPPLTRENARWMYDDAGRAILHLNSPHAPRHYDREIRPGPTGALHHVALRCSGYEEMRARLRWGTDRVTAVNTSAVVMTSANNIAMFSNVAVCAASVNAAVASATNAGAHAGGSRRAQTPRSGQPRACSLLRNGQVDPVFRRRPACASRAGRFRAPDGCTGRDSR
ncbi:MAG: hypothetical protein E6K22_15950 [Gammaproteobacteria bacterium]|nr:MAG: hypothetical protein E6K22_15950 [Gammaproteobacteria bacterium]